MSTAVEFETLDELLASPDSASCLRVETELHDVPWKLYCELRKNPSNWGKRMLYLDGELLILSPSRQHERMSRLLALLISQWAILKNVPLIGAGSTTFQHSEMGAGLEPDECFYFQDLSAINPAADVDLATEPPPDLVIEIDVSRSLRQKLSKYARFQVPEVWIWKRSLRVLALSGDSYQEVRESRVLPGFPIDRASELIVRQGNWTILVNEFVTFIQNPS